MRIFNITPYKKWSTIFIIPMVEPVESNIIYKFWKLKTIRDAYMYRNYAKLLGTINAIESVPIKPPINIRFAELRLNILLVLFQNYNILNHLPIACFTLHRFFMLLWWDGIWKMG